MKKIFIIIGTVALIGIVIPLIISFTQNNENISSEIKSEASLSITKILKIITIYQSFSEEEDGKIIVGTHTIFNIKIQEMIFSNSINTSSTIDYFPFDNDYNNLNQHSSQLVFTSVYNNKEFGISFNLPDNWSFEESPSFIDGVMTYNGNNIVFKDNEDEKFGFMLSISDNEKNAIKVEEVVNNILEENQRLYNDGEISYVWEYDKKYKINFEKKDAYVLENLKGPGGYNDLIYIVGIKYIYKFSYSYIDDDGISRTDNELREMNNKILNSIEIK